MSHDLLYGVTGQNNHASGVNPPAAMDRQGALLTSGLHGRYYEQVRRGNVFCARAIVTAPVIFSTAAGTGGPLLYNGTSAASGVNLVLLGLSITSTVVTTVAAALGITGGPTTAPGTTTAIDTSTNCLIGGATHQASAYRIGTPSAAGTFFAPLASVHTGALTVDNTNTAYIDLGGLFICPPGSFVSVAASTTASTLVAQMALFWEEVPV